MNTPVVLVMMSTWLSGHQSLCVVDPNKKTSQVAHLVFTTMPTIRVFVRSKKQQVSVGRLVRWSVPAWGETDSQSSYTTRQTRHSKETLKPNNSLFIVMRNCQNWLCTCRPPSFVDGKQERWVVVEVNTRQWLVSAATSRSPQINDTFSCLDTTDTRLMWFNYRGEALDTILQTANVFLEIPRLVTYTMRPN